VYALEQRALVRWTRRAPAEFVGALQLLEELDGIVDAVDAELKGIYVPGGERHRGLGAGAEGARGTEREVGLVFGLAEAGRRQKQ
jgi:hypothetical protein